MGELASFSRSTSPGRRRRSVDQSGAATGFSFEAKNLEIQQASVLIGREGDIQQCTIGVEHRGINGHGAPGRRLRPAIAVEIELDQEVIVALSRAEACWRSLRRESR